MPTIDELAPAVAAADTDEMLVSQTGITRKITRAQVIAGLQPQLSLNKGYVLGRSSTGTGTVETIAIGSNINLISGTLSANASSFTMSGLPAGNVPSPVDLVAISQAGTEVSVSYSQFVSSLSTVPGVDVSHAVLTPAGSSTPTLLANFASTFLQQSGGSLTGPLILVGSPAVGLAAATKAYVDATAVALLPKTGGSLTGALLLNSDPAIPAQAATKNYTDNLIAGALPKAGGTLLGPVTLSADPTGALHAATKEYVDSRLLRTGDTLAGPLILATAPVLPLQAATKAYIDASIQTALPLNGGTLVGTLILSADPVWPSQASTKTYVDAQVLTSLSKTGGSLTGPIVLAADPALSLQAATKQYVDTRVIRSGDTFSGPLALAADPIVPLQAATKNYVDNQVSSALPRTGGSLLGSVQLAADPVSALQPATKHYVDVQVATAVPTTGGTISGSLSMAAAPVTPASVANKQYVDAQVSLTLPTSGGTIYGPLTLATNPTANLHASTKQYVDSAIKSYDIVNLILPPYNAKVNGTADDTAAFSAAYQAASVNSAIHVPNGVTVLQNPSAWSLPTTKTVKWFVDGTTLPDGTSLASAIPTGGNPASLSLPGIVAGNSASGFEFSRGFSTTADFAVSHSSYVVNHSNGTQAVIANSRTDTMIYNSPNNYVWSGLDRLVWAGVQTPNSTTAAQHVARYAQTIRQSIGTNLSGVALPQPQLWTACLEYRDATGKPSSWANASLTVEMDWIGNGPDDASSRQVQSLVIAQNNTTGAPVEISSVVGVYLGGGSAGHAYRVFNVNIPFSTSILDTTGSQQLAGAAAIRMAAGHAIAFEPTASNTLSFDSSSGTLRWNQGGLSYTVGKGLAVGWANVCTSNTTLPSYLAGNMVFLVGSSSFTVTLPTATSTPVGTGFTFSNLTSAAVTIQPAGSDGIDNGPVILRQSDRYHVVSDGGGTWREVFRTNSVSPRFTGPPVLPSYTVGSLPTSPGIGAKAFTTNGRKPNEAAGAGSGVEVFFDGARWICGWSGAQVLS
jgi:hypothetical protein